MGTICLPIRQTVPLMAGSQVSIWYVFPGSLTCHIDVDEYVAPKGPLHC